MNNQSIVNSSLQYLRRIFSLAKVPVDVAVVNYQEDKLYKSSNITWDFKFQSSSGLGAERQGKLFKSDYDALEYAEKLKNQSLEAAERADFIAKLQQLEVQGADAVVKACIKKKKLTAKRYEDFCYKESCPECHGEKKVDCPRCKGTGTVKCQNCGGEGYVKCPECRGRGRIRSYRNGKSSERKCSKCNGKGKIRCPECKGKGELRCNNCAGRGKVMCHNCNGVGYLYKIFTCKIEALVSNQQLTAECRLFNANEIEKEFDKHYNELIRYAKNEITAPSEESNGSYIQHVSSTVKVGRLDYTVNGKMHYCYVLPESLTDSEIMLFKRDAVYDELLADEVQKLHQEVKTACQNRNNARDKLNELAQNPVFGEIVVGGMQKLTKKADGFISDDLKKLLSKELGLLRKTALGKRSEFSFWYVGMLICFAALVLGADFIVQKGEPMFSLNCVLLWSFFGILGLTVPWAVAGLCIKIDTALDLSWQKYLPRNLRKLPENKIFRDALSKRQIIVNACLTAAAILFAIFLL